ncbi:MAG: hypothetical protein AAF514_01325 [Verrucomicrobiota bacterium]
MRLLLLFAITTLLCSCGTARFKRAYEQAVSSPPTDGIEGAWDGIWRSDKNGHHGKLQCVVSLRPQSEDSYQFYFAGTYWKIFRFTYRQPGRVVQKGETYHLTGTRDLGWFGDFSHQGTVLGDTFHSTYKGGGDHGVFEMARARH